MYSFIILQSLPSISKREPWIKNSLRYIIHTKVGSGPQQLSDENSHLIKADGLPK